jgi:hypothetical protein
MNQQDFEELCKEIQRDTVDILVLKGREYAGSTDRLANFRRNAALTGVEPLTILHVYMAKHWDSFSTFVRDNQKGEVGELSEPIRGRLYDLINYAVLAIALIEDRPKEDRGAPVVWLFLEGVTEGQLVSGYEAESVWRALNRPWEPATFAGKRILAYRTSTDQPWTPLQ